MDEFIMLEEQLRQFAWMGDTEGIQKIINLGIDVNIKHAINGWTPLHWACKRNYLDAVVLLLKNGADKNIKSKKGETPASLATNPYILKLLNDELDLSRISIDQEAPTFVQNFVKNTPTNCKTDVELPQQSINNACQEEIVLKLRIADAKDADFIEVDILRNNLTYPNLIKICCEELEINAMQISKLRKLPNTRIRRNKDVQRLENFQEIEVVLYSPIGTDDLTDKSLEYRNGNSVPITPTNNYQSISKKDQTILY